MKRQSSKNNKGMDIQSLLRNRNALYVVLVLAVMNLFSYLMLRQLDAVAFFIIIGFLMTYFSKNMIVVMLTSIVSTFFLVQINMLGKRQEGMTSQEEGKETKEEEEAEEREEGEEYEDEGMEDKSAGTGTSTSGAGTSTTLPERPSSMTTSGTDISGAMREKITASQTAEIKPKKTNDEKFTQKLNPARYNSADDDSVPRHKPKIDYAATLESAYDNLDKLLSSDAIKNMSADTGRLAEKQKVLMDNIGKLTPIMDKASSVLNNLDMGGISGLMGGIQERLKGFNKQEAKDM